MIHNLPSINLSANIRYLKLILKLGDIILLNASYLFAFYVNHRSLELVGTRDSKIFLFVANFVWMYIMHHFNESTFKRNTTLEECVYKRLKLILYFFLAMASFAHLFSLHQLSGNAFTLFFLNFGIFILIYRIFTLSMLKKIRLIGKNLINTVIVGPKANSNDIINALTSDLSQGYRVMGYFDDNTYTESDSNYLGSIKDLFNYAAKNKIHEVYVTLSDLGSTQIKQMICFCDRNFIRIKFVPDYNLFRETNNVSIDFQGHVPVVSLRLEPLEQPLNRIKKRSFDIFFSLLVIVFIFPWLFPILMVLVKISSPGPIFFRQKRTGEGNREFYCWKFRTMRVNKDSDHTQATANDKRITPIGKFLRKTNLDEMPQFFNVLFGNMSVVGPRPHMIKHTNEYSELIDNYLVRHYAKPGITGWAQTNGLRGETKNLEKMAQRVQYDIWYIENWTFVLELKIIYSTIKNMIIGDKNAV
jgi:undecaprenyl-phosphate galactose phosphotransferase/putative colanic acid biosynthesis UDP-glucose lipid carrier transferase